ncbi:MAG: hypothetical protein IPO21_18640 [Bacteroidales bacterium]|nr:hypothetical protein [Bacteroidales bacterium]
MIWYLEQIVLFWLGDANHSGQLGVKVYCDEEQIKLCNTLIEPQKVSGGETNSNYLTNVVMVAAGESHSIALLASGEVLTWGDNYYGQLGNNNKGVNSYSPVFVLNEAGLKLKNIIAISAGASHCYALSASGLVYAWGNNATKQLADGSLIHKQFATLVKLNKTEILTDIVAISAGANHGLFLHKNGFVYGVGAYMGLDNFAGETYYEIASFPKKIVGGETGTDILTNVKAISAGYNHSLAKVEIDGNSYAVSWGDNKFYDIILQTYGGQLGVGDKTLLYSRKPMYVKSNDGEVLKNVNTILAGSGISLFELINQETASIEFWGCGANNVKQLLNNSLQDEYYAIEMNLPCLPLCPSAFLGPDLQLCAPFTVTLSSGDGAATYSYKWYYNDSVIDNMTQEHLLVSTPGVYKISIDNLYGNCKTVSDEVEIKENSKTFALKPNTFCNSQLTFEVYGKGNFNWYNSEFSSEVIGTGNIISLPKEEIETLIADSVYRLWIDDEGICQRLPVYATKKCDSCNELYLKIADTSLCKSNSYEIVVDEAAIFWFSDSSKNSFIAEGNKVTVPFLQLGENKLYYTHSKNNCESLLTPLIINVKQCNKLYSIKGKVFFPENITNTLTGKIICFYKENMHTPFVESLIKSDNTFECSLEAGIIKICFVPSSSLLDTLWFGNYYDIGSSPFIHLHSNIIEMKLDYGNTNALDEEDTPVFILTTPSKIFLESDDVIESIIVYSIQGVPLCEMNVNNKSLEIENVFDNHNILILSIIIGEQQFFYKILNTQHRGK